MDTVKRLLSHKNTPAVVFSVAVLVILALSFMATCKQDEDASARVEARAWYALVTIWNGATYKEQVFLCSEWEGDSGDFLDEVDAGMTSADLREALTDAELTAFFDIECELLSNHG